MGYLTSSRYFFLYLFDGWPLLEKYDYTNIKTRT